MTITRTQHRIIQDKTRFKVICAGRRWGKTHLALYWLLLAALSYSNFVCWFVSPSYRMSKNIAWRVLKEIVYSEPQIIAKKNESSLEIEFTNGSRIALKGADNYDSLRGVKLNRLVNDEFAYMNLEAWTEVLRPSLTDSKGEAMFIGTPDGYNHFHELYHVVNPDYKSWHFRTVDSPFIDPVEVEKAKQELDEKTFRQEYEASFENASGRVYYSFQHDKSLKHFDYDQRLPINLCVDFNVNPCKWAIIQNINDNDYVIDEVVKNDTHTEEMTKECLQRYPNAKWIVYGDYSGNSKSTKTESTDFDIIKSILKHSEIRIKPNPPVVDRVNAVNSRLCSMTGERRLYISPTCKHTMKDFETVTWKESKNKEIDKRDMNLTHISDAIGYYVEYEYSLKGKPKITYTTAV